MPPTPASQVDANLLAARGALAEREFELRDLPRVMEVGASKGAVSASLHFSELDAHPVVQGHLSGTVVMACQRCCADVDVVLDEPFALALVQSEEAAGLVAEQYDAVIADPLRLDLRWLVEEQVLLALPLIPRHDDEGRCALEAASSAGARAPDADSAQHPFANLRDLLRNS
jgi:uncharacterized protein